MALIGALNAGISGLRAQETRISVIGDNIANVDTVGFKQARVNFETMLSQTISFGTAPDGTLGGIDPPQIGKGVQVGIFDNGQQRTLAQIVLARFANPNGLIAQGGNVFSVGVNSGQPIVGTPGTFGFSVIRSGYLEESNVDLAQQFTELIVGQRAFQANARTITTSDQMLQELISMDENNTN